MNKYCISIKIIPILYLFTYIESSFFSLTGVQPFVETKFMSVRERVLRGDYSLSGECFTDISDDAKNMIKRMLTVNPIHRIKVEEIFIHSWMKVSYHISFKCFFYCTECLEITFGEDMQSIEKI